MFSFFKRWRSGDKKKAEEQLPAEEQTTVAAEESSATETLTAPEPISTEQTSPTDKTDSSCPEATPVPEPQAEASTVAVIVPDAVEIPAPSTIPEPVIPTASTVPDLPAPDADGKVRIKVTLNDLMPSISDEDLENAALAEIPEDSPLRYQTESEDLDAIEEETKETEGTDTLSPTAAINNESTAVVQNTSQEHEEPDAIAQEASLETIENTVEEVIAVEGGEEVIHSATPAVEKKSWLQRLKAGLSRTGSSISSLFVGVKVDEDLFEELETALIMADAGVEATQSLLTKLRAKVKKERIEDAALVKRALHTLLTEHLKPLEKRFVLDQDKTNVVMIAGVNGAGKTTSIGKLAHHFQASGASVLLAAGDTFRAAAREQLVAWGARNNVQVISQNGGDPAAVAFDAVNAGRARKTNVVMVDTAGRLPTQTHLMEELKKIKRVIGKADDTAPHEVLLVVDGNTGQNAIAQIRAFDAVLGLTGLVVTKLDGTAKGGTLAAVAAGSQGVRPIPVYWIGVGESLHDLQPFVASEFASALLGE